MHLIGHSFGFTYFKVRSGTLVLVEQKECTALSAICLSLHKRQSFNRSYKDKYLKYYNVEWSEPTKSKEPNPTD